MTLEQSMKWTACQEDFSPQVSAEEFILHLSGRNMLVRESVFLKLIKNIFRSCPWNFLLGSQKNQHWIVNNCNKTSNQTTSTAHSSKQKWDPEEFKDFQIQQIPSQNLPKHRLTLLKFILSPPHSSSHRFCRSLPAIAKNKQRARTIGKNLVLDTYIWEFWTRSSSKLIPTWKVRCKHWKIHKICFCVAGFCYAEVQKVRGKKAILFCISMKRTFFSSQHLHQLC